MWMWILLYLALMLSAIAVLVLLVTEYRTEIRPAIAMVYNNIWTGKTHCALPGTKIIIPGIHRVLRREVSLRNEAENPANVNLITGDGIELEVDYILRRFQVGYPEMPGLEDPALDEDKLEGAVIKAVTAIEYEKRRDKVLTRVVAELQESLEKRTLNELFPGTDLKTETTGTIDKNLMEEMEDEVNAALSCDIVTKEWGFWIEMDLEDYNLPIIIRKAREKSSSAEISGRALANKAKAAGIQPEWLVLAETVSSLLQGQKGGGHDSS